MHTKLFKAKEKTKRNNRRRGLWYVLPWLLWVILIFLLSHQDKHETTLSSGWLRELLAMVGLEGEWLRELARSWAFRKGMHMLVYAVLMWLTLRLSNAYWPDKTPFWRSFAFCLFYACSDEFHQTFIPGRFGTLWDVGIDSVGMLIAAGVWEGKKRFTNIEQGLKN